MSLFSFVLSLFYPEQCPYCSGIIKHKENACNNCKKEFPPYTFTRIAKGGYYCYSPFSYSGRFKTAVKRMKFNNHPEYSKKLVFPMAETINKNIENMDFDYITYVPMHKRKFNQRGYNQAELLAIDLGKLLNIPCADVLIKIKDNKEQHTCPKKERNQNVKGVYEKINPENIKGKNILIVDDIITTGCTLGECCKVLNKNGASKICCVTVCAVN